MSGSLDHHAEVVFNAGRRLAEVVGTFQGIRDTVVSLPVEASGPTAHAFNRIQATLLESMLLQSCALLAEPKWPSDVSLHKLARLMNDANVRDGIIAFRETWYPSLDARRGLIDDAKRRVKEDMQRFCEQLKTYSIDTEVQALRNKAIAHLTTDDPAPPLIQKVTDLADRALALVQIGHDIIRSGDSGLDRRSIFSKSGSELAWRAISE